MLALDIVFGAFLGVATGLLVALSFQVVNTNGKLKDEESGKFAGFNTLGMPEWCGAIGIGITVGVIFVLSPLAAHGVLPMWLNIGMFVIMVLIQISIMIYGGFEISSIGEAIPLIALAVIISWQAVSVAGYAALMMPSLFWSSVVRILPWVLLVISIGVFFASWLFFKREETGVTGFRIGGWAVKILAIVVAVAIIVPGVSWGAFSPADAGVGTAKAAEEVTSGLKVNEITYEELEALTAKEYAGMSRALDESSLTSHDAERTAKAGCSDALAYPCSSLSQIKESNMRNPSFLKTLCDFFKDKTVGNKKIGDINPWMREFSEKTEKHGIFIWCEWKDSTKTVANVKDDYRRYGAMMNTFIERFIDQGVQQRTTVENWCLRMTSTNNERWGEPASYQYTDDFIVLAYVGKNERGKANATGLFVFGFNIHDRRPAIFGDEPEPVTVTVSNDSPKGSTGGDEPTGSPGGDSPKGSPQNDNPKSNDKPKNDGPSFNKDKTKGTDAKPGQADENTNNPSDPNHSTKDTKDSSTSMTHEQYREDMNQKEQINNAQKEAGDSNKPTVEAPEGAKVDNAGAEAANKASQTTNEAKMADGSATTKPEKSGGDGQWGNGKQPE